MGGRNPNAQNREVVPYPLQAREGVKPETGYRREVRQIALPNDHSDHTRYNNGRDKASLGNEFNEFAFTAKFHLAKPIGKQQEQTQRTANGPGNGIFEEAGPAVFQRLKAVLATTGGKAGAYENPRFQTLRTNVNDLCGNAGDAQDNIHQAQDQFQPHQGVHPVRSLKIQ